MGIGLSIGLVTASILFFIGFLLFGVRTYKKKYTVSYDLRNTFPYEINYKTRFLDNIFVNVFLVLSMTSSIGYFAFFDIKNLSGVVIVILICGLLLSIINFFMFFADLKYIRFHLILLVLQSISAFGLAGSIGVFGLISFQKDNGYIVGLIVAILAIALGLFIFALMMNPKLNFRLEMVKTITPEGKETLVRPTYFVLAFTEWLFIFSLFISQLLLLILYIPF